MIFSKPWYYIQTMAFENCCIFDHYLGNWFWHESIRSSRKSYYWIEYVHAIYVQRDAYVRREVLFFFPFSFVKCNFLGINHSKNIKFGENMCNGVIFQKITKNGIFYQVSHICGSSMTLGRGDIFQKKNSTPIIPVFVFFHFNIRNWMKISRFFMLYMVYITYLQ